MPTWLATPCKLLPYLKCLLILLVCDNLAFRGFYWNLDMFKRNWSDCGTDDTSSGGLTLTNLCSHEPESGTISTICHVATWTIAFFELQRHVDMEDQEFLKSYKSIYFNKMLEIFVVELKHVFFVRILLELVIDLASKFWMFTNCSCNFNSIGNMIKSCGKGSELFIVQ